MRKNSILREEWTACIPHTSGYGDFQFKTAGQRYFFCRTGREEHPAGKDIIDFYFCRSSVIFREPDSCLFCRIR